MSTSLQENQQRQWRLIGGRQVSASYLLGPLSYCSSVTFSIHSTTFPFNIDIAIASCVLN
jgi:hypothetical protein